MPTKPVLRPALTSKSLADATARYSTTDTLRKLLTHDEERGGIPIRLLSARWLLTHFQAEGNEAARLEHRQWLEREHPEAFVSGEALERVLAEVEERTKWKDYMEGGARQLHEQGEERRVARRHEQGQIGDDDEPVQIAFPSAMALSHMWLDKAHPDPNARNLRDMWLPAIEWLYSERVRQLGGEYAVGEGKDMARRTAAQGRRRHATERRGGSRGGRLWFVR